MHGAKIYDLSDSEATFKALGIRTFEFKLVFNYFSILNLLAEQNKVTLMWLPRQKDCECYEKQDSLDKKGNEFNFYWLRGILWCTRKTSYEKSEIRKTENKTNYWNNIIKLINAKKFIT